MTTSALNAGWWHSPKRLAEEQIRPGWIELAGKRFVINLLSNLVIVGANVAPIRLRQVITVGSQ